MRTRKQTLITQLMECGRLSPLDGYRRLRANYNSMTPTEWTTDYCQAMLDLDEYNDMNFVERILL